MKSPRTTPLPNNLFPMLSVLVGMIGALIVLLLAVTKLAQTTRDRAARAQAAARRPELPKRHVAKAPPTLPALPTTQPLGELPQIPSLVDRRPELEARISQLQAVLEDLERKSRAEQAERDGKLAQSKLDAAKIAQELRAIELRRNADGERIAKLQAECERVDRELRERRLQAKQVENRFAIVPYRGPNGTKRRPIYLECRADRIILQPEGVAITAEAMRDAGPDAMLVAAINAVTDKAPPLDSAEMPYPLLLVRPDGIAAFYMAQRALMSAKIDTGFELLDGKIALAFGKPDAELAAVLKATIADRIAQVGQGVAPESNVDSRQGVRAAVAGVSRARSTDGGNSFLAGNAANLGTSSFRAAASTARRPAAFGDRIGVSGIAGSTTTKPGESGKESIGSARDAGSGAVRPPFESAAAGSAAVAATDGQRAVSKDGVRGDANTPTAKASNDEPKACDSATISGARAKGIGNEPLIGRSTQSGEDAATPVTFDQLMAAGERRVPADAEVDAPRESDPVGIGVGIDRKPLRKEMIVVCRSDSLLVQTTGKSIDAGAGQSIESVRMQLVDELRGARVGWGSPGPLFRWRPVVVFVVAPDGLETYYRVRLGWRNPPALLERASADGPFAERAGSLPEWR